MRYTTILALAFAANVLALPEDSSADSAQGSVEKSAESSDRGVQSTYSSWETTSERSERSSSRSRRTVPLQESVNTLHQNVSLTSLMVPAFSTNISLQEGNSKATLSLSRTNSAKELLVSFGDQPSQPLSLSGVVDGSAVILQLRFDKKTGFCAQYQGMWLHGELQSFGQCVPPPAKGAGKLEAIYEYDGVTEQRSQMSPWYKDHKTWVTVDEAGAEDSESTEQSEEEPEKSDDAAQTNDAQKDNSDSH